MPDVFASGVIKPAVQKLAAYTLVHHEVPVKLDQNENPFEMPDDLKREIAANVMSRPWGRYPEFVPASMTAALARFTGWPASGILAGNGSNELIQATLAVTLGPGRRIVIPQPTFTLYKLMATIFEAEIDEVPLTSPELAFDAGRIADAASTAEVTVICSPNNPTGGLLKTDALVQVLERARGLVLLDEAYHEFSGQSAAPLLKEHRNLVVLRTSSKALAMAGLRFGYLMTDPAIAAEIHKAKLPYNINVFTLAAAETAFANRARFDAAIERIVAERERVFVELGNRPAVRVYPSKANFLLIRTAMPAGELFHELRKEGVLVRNVSAYPMLDRCLRVSIGSPDENNRFLTALDRALENL